MSHILCFIKTQIHHTLIDVRKFINSFKYSYVSIDDGHELMMMYDIHMHLDSLNVTTNNSLERITITFNSDIQKAIHIVCVYKVHSFSISTFFKRIQNIIEQSLEHRLIIILRYFNVEYLRKK